MQTGLHACNAPGPSLRAAWCTAALLLLAGACLQASALNRWLLAWLQAKTPTAPALWSALSVLGLGWSAWIVVAALDRRGGRAVAWLLPGLLIGGVLTHLPKWLLATTRPAAALPLSSLQVVGEPIYGGGAMPSGHALTAFAVLALLWLAMPARRLWHAVGLLVAGLIAWSRVAVGAHWPADLLAGAGLGLMTALLAHRLVGARWQPNEWVPARNNFENKRPEVTSSAWVAWWASDRGRRATGMIELLAGAALLFTHTGYPKGRPMQAALALLALVSAMQRFGAWRRLRTWIAEEAEPPTRQLPPLEHTPREAGPEGMRPPEQRASA